MSELALGMRLREYSNCVKRVNELNAEADRIQEVSAEADKRLKAALEHIREGMVSAGIKTALVDGVFVEIVHSGYDATGKGYVRIVYPEATED